MTKKISDYGVEALPELITLVVKEIINYYSLRITPYDTYELNQKAETEFYRFYQPAAEKIVNLINNGADVNTCEEGSAVNALHVAVLANDGNLIKFLIEKGIDIGAVSSQDRTILSYAAKNQEGGMETVMLLMHHLKKIGVNLDELKNKALSSAIHLGRKGAIELMFEGASFDQNDLDKIKNAERKSDVAAAIKRITTDPLQKALDRIGRIFERRSQLRREKIASLYGREMKTNLVNHAVEAAFSDLLALAGSTHGNEAITPTTIIAQALKRVYVDFKATNNFVIGIPDSPDSVESVLELRAQTANRLRNMVEMIEKICMPLVRMGADCNVKTIDDHTLLHFVAFVKRQQDFDELVNKGADFNAVTQSKKSVKDFGESVVTTDGLKIKMPQVAANKSKKVLPKKAPESQPQEQPIVTKSPQEKWQSCADDVKKSLNAKTTIKSSTIDEMLKLLDEIALNDEMLHLIARSANALLIAKAVEKNADFNTLNQDKKSALRLIFENEISGNEAKFLALESKTLLAETIENAIRFQVEKKGGQAVGAFLKVPNVTEKISAKIPTKEAAQHNQFIQFLKKNSRTAADGINAVMQHVEEREQAKKSATETPATMSKNARDKLRKEQNKIKAEQEAQEKAKREELAKERQETEAMHIEDERSKRAMKLPDDAKTEYQARDKMAEEDLQSKQMNLQPDEAKEIRRIQRNHKQMQQFLSERKTVSSIQDLPEFLQPKIRRFLQKDYDVLLKGSVVYSAGKGRKPNDFDLEIRIKNASSWTNAEAIKFAADNFGVQIDESKIYRGFNAGSQTFTINICDTKSGLEVTVFDPEKMVTDALSWTNSREIKLRFNKDETVEKVLPLGLSHSESEFVINPKSNKLIMRLCFMSAAGYENPEVIYYALRKELKSNPIDLLIKECGVDLYQPGVDRTIQAKEKITAFMNAHNLTSQEKLTFLATMEKVSKIQIVSNNVDVAQEEIREKVSHAITELKFEAANLIPSPEGFFTNAAKLQVENSQISSLRI